MAVSCISTRGVSRDTAWEKLDKKQELPVFVHLLSLIKITPYLKPEWTP
jgi:hypothetical protein